MQPETIVSDNDFQDQVSLQGRLINQPLSAGKHAQHLMQSPPSTLSHW